MATMKVGFNEETVSALQSFTEKIEKALQALAPVETHSSEPKEPGFYAYTGGNQIMVFLLDHSGQWHAIFENASVDPCAWEYIEQALSVYSLVRIDALMGGL